MSFTPNLATKNSMAALFPYKIFLERERQREHIRPIIHWRLCHLLIKYIQKESSGALIFSEFNQGFGAKSITDYISKLQL